MAKQPMAKDLKLALSSSGVLVILSALLAGVLSRPQCPDHYTQAQIDAANCVSGANIGAGIILLYVMVPLVFLVIIIWVVTLRRLMKERLTTKKS